DVVDGEYTCHITKCRVLRVLRSQQHRNQSTLPIMTMKDVWDAKHFRTLQNRAREERKALGIVGIIARRSSIESVAIEIRRVFDEIEPYTRMASICYDRTEPVAVIERNRDAAHHRLRVVQFSLSITWNIHTHLMSRCRQSSRQSSDYVG